MSVNEQAPSPWVARINTQQLAALTVTVRKIQSIVGDANSTVRHLTDALMSDPSLSAKLLKISNSPSYMLTPDPVTTVSRAATLIGFDAIRNICITSRILDALLADHGLPERIVDRLLDRLAASLHAAIQTRMLMHGATMREREEAFLGALLAQIGESAFWSLGDGEAIALDRALRQPDVDRDAVVRSRLGISFRELSVELIRSWGLEDAITHRPDPYGTHLHEHEYIRFANDLADCVCREGWGTSQLEPLYDRAAGMLHCCVEDAAYRLRACGKEAEEIASCYGASALARRMAKKQSFDLLARAPAATVAAPAAAPATAVTAASDATATAATDAAPAPVAGGSAATAAAPPRAPTPRTTAPVADPAVQLKVLREMTALLSAKTDINTVIRTAMEGVHRGIGMDRTITALLTPDRSRIQTRFWLGDDGENWNRGFHFGLAGAKNIFHDCINTGASFHYQAAVPGLLADRVPEPLQEFSGHQDFLIGPVQVGLRPIGVLYADRARSRAPLTAGDFDEFGHILQQLNLCLGQLNQKR